MKKQNKKGFTLVELLVVIAILAILGTVGVVGYTAFINKANVSNDTSFVSQLSMYAKAAELDVDGEDYKYVEQVNEQLDQFDLSSTSFQPTAKGYHYGFDVEKDEFVLIEDAKASKNLNIFAFVNSLEDAQKMDNYYSLYLQGTDGSNYYASDDSTKTLTLGVGVDTGKVESLNIKYENNSSSQDVVIRTSGGTLTVKAYVGTSDCDILKHYGDLEKLDIVTNGVASYHEFGTVDFANIQQGRVVAEDKSIIEIAYVSATAAFAQEKDSGLINLAYASNADVKAASDVADSTGFKKTLIYVSGKSESEMSNYANNISCTVNGKGYTNLQEAIDAANAGDVIKIVKDFTIDTTINVTKSLTLNVNGHTITNKVSGNYMLNIKNSNTHFIVDGTEENSKFEISNEVAEKTYGFLTINAESYFNANATLYDNVSYTINGGSYIGDGIYKVSVPGDDEHACALFDVGNATNINVTFNGIYSEAHFVTFNMFYLDTQFHLYVNDCEMHSVEHFAVHIDIDATDKESAGCYFKNTKIISTMNNCVQTAGGYAVFDNCDFLTERLDNPQWSSCALAIAYGGNAEINSGNYVSKGASAVAVYSSDGQFTINGGNFEGKIGELGNWSGKATMTINGGKFAHDDGTVDSFIYLSGAKSNTVNDNR